MVLDNLFYKKDIHRELVTPIRNFICLKELCIYNLFLEFVHSNPT